MWLQKLIIEQVQFNVRSRLCTICSRIFLNSWHPAYTTDLIGALIRVFGDTRETREGEKQKNKTEVNKEKKKIKTKKKEYQRYINIEIIFTVCYRNDFAPLKN